MTSSRHLLPAVVAAGVLVASLAGCAAAAPVSASSSRAPVTTTPASPPVAESSASTAQSKADACRILNSSFGAMGHSISSDLSSYDSDPRAAVADLQKASKALHTRIPSVTQPQAARLARKAEADVDDLVSATAQEVDDPTSGLAAMEKILPVFTSDGKKLVDYCG